MLLLGRAGRWSTGLLVYWSTHCEQRLSDLVDAAEYDGGEVHLGQGGGGGGDGGHYSAAGEVLDGGVQEDGGHCQGGQYDHQPQDLSTRLNLLTNIY